MSNKDDWDRMNEALQRKIPEKIYTYSQGEFWVSDDGCNFELFDFNLESKQGDTMKIIELENAKPHAALAHDGGVIVIPVEALERVANGTAYFSDLDNWEEIGTALADYFIKNALSD